VSSDTWLCCRRRVQVYSQLFVMSLLLMVGYTVLYRAQSVPVAEGRCVTFVWQMARGNLQYEVITCHVMTSLLLFL
jgi:hypothetical protein